jgi:DNA-binding response OmpR family regulator
MHERILIVCDEQRSGWLRGSLAPAGFLVTIADDANRGYEHLSESGFDLVIVNLGDSAERLDFIKRMRANPNLRQASILAIGEWGTGQPTMALIEGADGFEPGPVDAERLIVAVRRLLQPNLTMIARASGVDGELD